MYCVTSHQQVKAALRELTSPLCNSAPDKLWENEGSTSMYITLPLTVEMRLEALKTHGTRLWSTTSKQATRQLLLCYRRKPNQSAVCCSLRLNCTAMFQILVSSAVYTRTIDSTQESRKVHANASALSTSGFCREKHNRVNKPEWCITWITSSIDHYTQCGVAYNLQNGRCMWFRTSAWHEWHPFMIIKWMKIKFLNLVDTMAGTCSASVEPSRFRENFAVLHKNRCHKTYACYVQ